MKKPQNCYLLSSSFDTILVVEDKRQSYLQDLEQRTIRTFKSEKALWKYVNSKYLNYEKYKLQLIEDNPKEAN
jgi:hypothetical protein